MKKILTKLMAVVCTLSACLPIVACGGEEGPQIDSTKAQLHISNFNGGVGHDWLDAHIARFEKDYAETEFVPGTKGVQIWVTNHKSGLVELGSKLKNAEEDIYFLEKVNYHDALAQGYFLDITDVVTEPLTEFGETATIEDKLYESQKQYYKTNGKYYGLPHAQSPTLLTYDADLFDRLGLYFGENGKLGKKSTDTGLSKGADGKAGTYDDGLPATYDEFFTLCSTMKKRGVAPMIWSGMYEWYTTRFAKQLRVDFDGAEEAMTAYDFDGTMTHIVDTIDNKGNITYKAPVTITEQNGYEAFSSASYYYTYKFLEEIYKNGYYSDKSINENVSHSGAQNYFLLSSFTSEQDIGMLVEGLYWVNEAKPMFNEMSVYQGSSLKERNLKVMPMPKATADKIGEKTTVVDSLNQLAFISAYVPEEIKGLAKTFLRYVTTQQSLEEFLLTTGLTRNFQVDYSGIYNELTPYSKSIVDMLGVCDYIMPASTSTVFQKNYSAFYDTYEIGTTKYAEPINAIRAGISAVDFFNQFRAKYDANSWNALLG